MRAIFLVLLAAVTPLSAFTPELDLINPRGGQRGTEMEVHFHGERLEEISEALFYQPGLSLLSIQSKDAKHAVAKIAIAPDAALGEHSLRLRCARGITELRSFWVGQFPSVEEVEPNASFDQAQRVELNTTVTGTAGNEDDDYYVCSLKKGQRLSVEVEAMRLGRTMFDAYVAILDPRKFELGSCDDTPLLRNDAFVSIIAPEDGDYRIVVHEAAYEGNDQCQYRLHIGTFPRPRAIFPSGARPGETVEFTFIGDPAGPIRQSFTVPADASGRFPIFPEQDGLLAPSPHWIMVSPLETVHAGTENGRFKTATPVSALPAALHGIVNHSEAEGWFRFSAKKDQNLVFTVLARSLRSPLDSVLSIHDAKGKQIGNNDDQGSPDSVISWTCPADGEYGLRIRDQLGRTGADFSYRIEITEKGPSIAASLPIVERVQSQKWKTFPIPRGNRYAAVINLSRENIACDAVFEATSLPAGVTLDSPKVARSMNSFPVVFEAAADAPIAGGLHEFLIRTAGDAPPLTAKLIDTIHHVDINNQGSYHSVTLDKIATSVIEEAPFKIDLETPKVPIAKNGTLGVKVRATRKEGYAEKITVRFLWNPPGISGPVTVDMPGDQSEISYELNASNDAAPGEWQICVVGEASTPMGPVRVASALTPLKVSEPFVSMAFDLAATEQGKSTTMIAKIEILQEFDGLATVDLVGLPHGATCPQQSFTKAKNELSFPITIAADAKVGKHNGVFCRVHIPQNGSTILHQTAMGSTLRIDAPAPTTTAKAETKPTPPKDAPAGAKPLSRLEQLRQQAK